MPESTSGDWLHLVTFFLICPQSCELRNFSRQQMTSSKQKLSSFPGSAAYARGSEFLETAPASASLKAKNEELLRYRGNRAQLGMLAAQLRSARDLKDGPLIAQAAARLSNQLSQRRVELKDRIAFAELALRKQTAAELTVELVTWWAGAGDHAHAASLLQSVVTTLPIEKRGASWRLAGALFAKAKMPRQAHQAFAAAANEEPEDPIAHEAMGALGFSSELPSRNAALSYLTAAVLRHQRREDSAALENFVRAFEVDPSCDESAEALSDALRARGRSGAADEILRAHARHGSASQRAGFYQRRFIRAVQQGLTQEAVEAALEASLDVEIALEELESAFAQLQKNGELKEPSEDFESFLLQLAVQGPQGARGSYGLWLGALILVHISEWGASTTEALLLQLGQICPEFQRAALPTDFADEAHIRALRQQLSLKVDADEQRSLRLRIAWGEVALGRFEDAFEVLEPLAALGEVWGNAAVLACIVAGRVMRPITRYRGLTALARALPPEVGAVVAGVAAEGFLNFDMVEEAHLTSEIAILLDSGAGRAVASRALVALRRPAVSSVQELEESLSVLVARSDACRMLAASAEQRGSFRLALTWGERLFQLRPGDPEAAESYLRLALSSQDPERLAEVLRSVLAAPFSLASVEESLADGVRALRYLSKPRALEEGEALLAAGAIRSPVLRSALSELAETTAGPILSAGIIEAQLVNADAEVRPALYLSLFEARFAALDQLSALRALRRALSAGAEVTLIQDCYERLVESKDPDFLLARIELIAEVARHNDALTDTQRADCFFELGVARFDLAEDRSGAFSAFERGADLDESMGMERLAHHLQVLLGTDVAAESLERWSRHLKSKSSSSEVVYLGRKASLLGLAAELYLEDGKLEKSFALAQEALGIAPELTEYLTTAERAAGVKNIESLEIVYQALSDAALGSNGVKAIHYRAARYWERQEEFERALQHAVLAFEALPAEGVAYILMVRLSRRTKLVEAAQRALKNAGENAQTEEESQRWLERAAALADDTMGSGLEHLELMIRGFIARPEVATAEDLAEAFLIGTTSTQGEESLVKGLKGRLEKLCELVHPHLVGIEGASVRLLLALIALRDFSDISLAVVLIKEAMELDRELPEYELLILHAPLFRDAKSEWQDLLQSMRLLAAETKQSFGRELATFLSACAEAQADWNLAGLFGVRAAQENPEDQGYIARTRLLALRAERDDLLIVLDELLPERMKAALLLESLNERSGVDVMEALFDIDTESLEPELAVAVLQALGALQKENQLMAEAGQTWRSLVAIAPQN